MITIPIPTDKHLHVVEYKTGRSYAETGITVTIRRVGEPEVVWLNPVFYYPTQPLDTYAVPVVDFDGKGPIPWPTGGI